MKFDLDNHQQRFPHSAIVEKEGRYYFWWLVVNMYKRKHNYYGELPPSLMERIKSLFPFASPILHLFSGSIESGMNEWTVDINPELLPDICCKAEDVSSHFDTNFFDLCIADPPYSQKHADKYNCKMPNTAKVMRELSKVIRSGGIVAWISTHPPLYRKEEWRLAGIATVDNEEEDWEVIGKALLHSGTNRVLRGVIFMERL